MSYLSTAERFRALGRERAGESLAVLDCREPGELDRDWWFWRRKAQLPPPGNWRIWLMMAGRGFGKTRAGAEWVRGQALANPRARIALVGATMADARAVMIEGSSGLLSVSHPDDRLLWAPSLNRLRWGNGAEARLFSAAEPEGLRGPEHTHAWCDEIGKWPEARCEAAWANLMLGLRRGRAPRVLATTTPRAMPLVRRLARDPAVVTTRGGTHDNAVNLAPTFIADMVALYGGTQLGRQEIDGELIEDVEGALWTRGMIEGARADLSPSSFRGGVRVGTLNEIDASVPADNPHPNPSPEGGGALSHARRCRRRSTSLRHRRRVRHRCVRGRSRRDRPCAGGCQCRACEPGNVGACGGGLCGALGGGPDRGGGE